MELGKWISHQELGFDSGWIGLVLLCSGTYIEREAQTITMQTISDADDYGPHWV